MVSVTHLILRFANVQNKFQQTNKTKINHINDNHIKFEVSLHFWWIWPTVGHQAAMQSILESVTIKWCNFVSKHVNIDIRYCFIEASWLDGSAVADQAACLSVFFSDCKCFFVKCFILLSIKPKYDTNALSIRVAKVVTVHDDLLHWRPICLG